MGVWSGKEKKNLFRSIIFVQFYNLDLNIESIKLIEKIRIFILIFMKVKAKKAYYPSKGIKIVLKLNLLFKLRSKMIS